MTSKEMPRDPIERAAAVASDYEGLQGLTAIAIGVGMLLTALLPEPIYGLVFVAMSGALGQGYYYKKYGRVRRRGGQVWAELGAVLVLAVLVIATILVDHYLQLPILTGPLAAAVGFWVVFNANYRHVGSTKVHLVVLAVLALSSLLPPLGVITGISFGISSWGVDLLLLGLAFIVIGIADHVRLTNAMRSTADA